MEQETTYFLVEKKHCQIYVAGTTNKYIDKGERFLMIEYRYFNRGVYDISDLREATGIEIVETGQRYPLKKINKSQKNFLLYFKNPELLLQF